MKAKLIILAVWIGIVVWYGYEVYSVQKEKAEWQAQQHNTVNQE